LKVIPKDNTFFQSYLKSEHKNFKIPDFIMPLKVAGARAEGGCGGVSGRAFYFIDSRQLLK